MASVVVMAKAAIPGRVKTRLIGPLTAEQAAAVQGAMLHCVLHRVGESFSHDARTDLVLAMDAVNPQGPGLPQIDSSWLVIDQGQGDLGDRLLSVWQRLRPGPVIFLGVDSPDMPVSVLESILPALDTADAALGPVPDGGYWTLASCRPQPLLVQAIDWGGDTVYHQTHAAARRAGVDLVDLDPWFDVDTFEDLAALRGRLSDLVGLVGDAALVRLAAQLDQICGKLKP